jgi:hypothetical protein
MVAELLSWQDVAWFLFFMLQAGSDINIQLYDLYPLTDWTSTFKDSFHKRDIQFGV